MFQLILAIFMATKLIERNWQFFRCFNRFGPFFWVQSPLTKIDNFSDVSTYFSQFSCDKTHWKMIDSFQMFQQILAIFWQQNPLKKIDSFQMFRPIFDIFLATKPIEKNWLFSDVSTDFGHFLATKPINTFSASYENTRSKRGFRTFLTFAALDIFPIEIDPLNSYV